MISSRLQRLLIIIISLILFLSAISLILVNIKSNITFFLTPSEIMNKKINSDDKIRIGGLVKKESVIFDKNNSQFIFIITDNKNEIKVEFIGILPDLFKEGTGVVAEGKLSNNILIAKKVFAKHDEKYMPVDITNQIKESGNWKKIYK